jgi:hypothetical protein
MLLAAACAPRQEAVVPAPPDPPMLPDLSGLGWIADGRFLAVHDAKNPDENDRARAGVLAVAATPAGSAWAPLEVEWPDPLGPSSDLEAVAPIPGTQTFLLIESGEGVANGRQYRRVFRVRIDGSRLRILSFAELPGTIRNIEGAAVARVGGHLVLLFAERAEGEPATDLVWADLQLEPLAVGSVQHARFGPDGSGRPGWRPVTAIEIDRAGRIYIGSAYDPGDDNGPFQSAIWLAGRVEAGPGGGAVVVVSGSPQRVATLDGFKVESLAFRPIGDGEQLFAGTDDENHGGTIRPILLPDTIASSRPARRDPERAY